MNPDLSALIAGMGEEMVFGQALARRAGRGFELRHVADRDAAAQSLQSLAVEELRGWAQFAQGGAFRPLKSAPNLRRGWRATAVDGTALGLCLHHLYPGAVADWHAAQAQPPPVTSYREFAKRQTGMYRITAKLNDAAAGAVVRACCHPDSCLKRRLWTVGQLKLDGVAEKSLIPCLEPCAILVELARKAARWEQEAAARRRLRRRGNFTGRRPRSDCNIRTRTRRRAISTRRTTRADCDLSWKTAGGRLHPA